MELLSYHLTFVNDFELLECGTSLASSWSHRKIIVNHFSICEISFQIRHSLIDISINKAMLRAHVVSRRNGNTNRQLFSRFNGSNDLQLHGAMSISRDSVKWLKKQGERFSVFPSTLDWRQGFGTKKSSCPRERRRRCNKNRSIKLCQSKYLHQFCIVIELNHQNFVSLVKHQASLIV